MIAVPGFEGRAVAVVGLGRSGLPAAEALRAGGARVRVWDDGEAARQAAAGAGFEVTDLTGTEWSDLAALVLSPGVPLTHPAPHWSVARARDAGVEIIGDLELFARAMAALPQHARPRVIAITGTNGKSTTTALIGWLLRSAGLSVHVGGNIGIGVLSLPAPVAGSVYVLEASSYQLDLTGSFAPDVAVLTNISPDHLERHGDMVGYVAAKQRLFRNLSGDQVAVFGVDDDWSAAMAETLRERGGRVESVSVHGRPADVTRSDQWLFDAGEPLFDLASAPALFGAHNAQNAGLAWLAVRALGLGDASIAAGLRSFPGLAHRMEEVGRLGGVRFINDSKATNADAARQALQSFARVHWIGGGRAKSDGAVPLLDLTGRMAHAYLIGEAAASFADVLGARVGVTLSGTLEQAVRDAFEGAVSDAEGRAGEDAVVLFSPACASFDQYPDFEVRGEAFRAHVAALGARMSTGGSASR
ncbi:MAG: UDP-N-acetylmuramoyl-L-alanine--D-glutamate ligase [Brevundimonas sp.]|jgi:UDP-N-acetylmuramoylalanine--D-glutamate ligase|uniref:UDP-N-acetylmuramoyl-L-alanine--D-glutamate ligase n=1 Tax=Brevundimonas sp. TaxID=1871086 RepID=UPI00391B7346